MSIEIKLPGDVKRIIDTLEAAGYEAYAVGGCVRDSLLGRTPNDWDITTSAKPYETKALFKHTFDTGIQHGTVSVLLNKEIYEVTTYRIDGEYEDSRHPNNVSFTGNLSEDLLRRDFTINAMAYNPARGIVDLYGGLQDLENHIIRCVGNPYDRFSEDALRIMRAVRFAAQLEYVIEPETAAAIKKLAPSLSKISAERIQVELVKMLLSDHPEYIEMAYDLGITRIVLPEFDVAMRTEQRNIHHCYTVGRHTLEVLKNVRSDKVLRLAALFHDLGKPACARMGSDGVEHFPNHPPVSEKLAHDIMRRLKFDNDTERRVCKLVRSHDWTINAVTCHMRRYVNRIGEESFPAIFELNYADLKAQSDYQRVEKLAKIDALKAAYNEIIDKGECVSLKSLAVSGKDLIDMGFTSGPNLGKVLNELLEVVLDDPLKNTKEQLLELAASKKESL